MKDLEALTGEHFQRLTAIKGGDWRTYPHRRGTDAGPLSARYTDG
jgi:hypothetical protein